MSEEPQDKESAEAPSPAEPAPPRTGTVLGLLAMTALIFSYLGSYALAGAMVNAEIIPPWKPDNDPRPIWLISGFVVLMVAFTGVGAMFRWLSRRQLRAIDAMESDE